MQRLLHEGMDAGLCGFSIQRLGRELHPGRLRRHARWSPTPCATRTSSCLAEVLRRARRGLHPDHPGHRRHQGTTWPSWRSWPRWPSARSSTTPSPPPGATPTSTAVAATGCEQVLGQGPADLRPGRHHPHRLRLHASSTGTSTTPPAVAGASPPAPTRRSWPRWPTPSCARRWSEAESRSKDAVTAVQAGVGGPPREARSCRASNGQRRARAATSAGRSEDIGRGARASTPSR